MAKSKVPAAFWKEEAKETEHKDLRKKLEKLGGKGKKNKKGKK